MGTFTARELRIISDHLETLTKARNANAALGVPTTPDVFTARFHTGLYAVLRWCPAARSSEPARHRFIQATARHRDSYQIDLGASPDLENAIPLKDPWQRQREQRASRAGRVPLGLDPDTGNLVKHQAPTPGGPPLSDAEIAARATGKRE